VHGEQIELKPIGSVQSPLDDPATAPKQGDEDAPQGVFNTRSPERPNPIGLHRVEIAEIRDNRLRVHGLEALDGTPILDLKPVLSTDVGER
jgi:tRNA (Thr-GGU) A37 N-methylase